MQRRGFPACCARTRTAPRPSRSQPRGAPRRSPTRWPSSTRRFPGLPLPHHRRAGRDPAAHQDLRRRRARARPRAPLRGPSRADDRRRALRRLIRRAAGTARARRHCDAAFHCGAVREIAIIARFLRRAANPATPVTLPAHFPTFPHRVPVAGDRHVRDRDSSRALWSGWHGAWSAVLGGAVSVAAGVAFAVILGLSLGDGRPAGVPSRCSP